MFTINVEVRKDQGKGASRRLRAANKFPAIVYGGKEANGGSEENDGWLTSLYLALDNNDGCSAAQIDMHLFLTRGEEYDCEQ